MNCSYFFLLPNPSGTHLVKPFISFQGSGSGSSGTNNGDGSSSSSSNGGANVNSAGAVVPEEDNFLVWILVVGIILALLFLICCFCCLWFVTNIRFQIRSSSYCNRFQPQATCFNFQWPSLYNTYQVDVFLKRCSSINLL